MKKQFTILSLCFALTSSYSGFSQETRIQPCNTYAAMEAYFNENPAAKASYDAGQKTLQESFQEYAKGKAAGRTAATVYTVPVVFHILHQGGPENVSDQVCINALKQVNEDFARMGADT